MKRERGEEGREEGRSRDRRREGGDACGGRYQLYEAQLRLRLQRPHVTLVQVAP